MSPASDERGVQIVSMAEAASGAAAWDRIEIMHDAGQIAADIWIDHHSHLIFRIVDADGRHRMDFTNYRKVSGVLVPFTEVIDGMTVKSTTVKFEAADAVSFSLPTGRQP
jgi:hypothetical protein